MRLTARVEGMGRLRRALLNVTGEGLRTVQREVKRSALNIQNGAKRRCPVDTGRLRNSIAHEIDEDGLNASVGTDVEYGPYVEFGTYKMAAQPYLFPAAEEERPEFIARLQRELGEAYVRLAE